MAKLVTRNKGRIPDKMRISFKKSPPTLEEINFWIKCKWLTRNQEIRHKIQLVPVTKQFVCRCPYKSRKRHCLFCPVSNLKVGMGAERRNIE